MKSYCKYYADRIQKIDKPEESKELAGMCAYIDRTPCKHIFTLSSPYHISYGEFQALWELSRISMFDAFHVAFDYGRAKGYRAARNEAKATRAQ